MPVNLRELPEQLGSPAFPGKVRWLLVVLLCTATGFGLALLFRPDESQTDSLWFWSRALAFPLVIGVFLYGLRLLAHENREAYVNGWNSTRADLESTLIAQGQEAIALLATSYCTAGGSEHLAESLRSGSKPLQTVFLPFNGKTMRWSPLLDPQPLAPEEHALRVQIWLDRVLAAPAVDLERLFPGQAVRVRIRHNRVLADDVLLDLWQSCARQRGLNIESVSVASEDDGLLWLDTWLDQEKAFPLVLSIELNLFDKPAADQAESISAVLLARSAFCQAQGLQPAAWVHRPVVMSCEPHSLREVLLWGGVSDDALPFAWQAQVPSALLRDLSRSLAEEGRPLASEASLSLDETLGAAGSAVGNIALIVGSEQAAADQQPQLLMVQDGTPQWCAVRPVQ